MFKKLCDAKTHQPTTKIEGAQSIPLDLYFTANVSFNAPQQSGAKVRLLTWCSKREGTASLGSTKHYIIPHANTGNGCYHGYSDGECVTIATVCVTMATHMETVMREESSSRQGPHYLPSGV